MNFRIQLIAVADDGTEQVHEIADIHRGEPTLATLGLTLEESKQILHQLQQTIVDAQVAAFLDQQRACPACGEDRQLKQSEIAPFRTLFGQIPCPIHAGAIVAAKRSRPRRFAHSPRSCPSAPAPNLLYLETKWAALVPYGVTAKLLHEVLPIDQQHSVATVRNHTLCGSQPEGGGTGRRTGRVCGGLPGRIGSAADA